MSTYERDPNTGDLNLLDGMRSIDDVKALMLEFCYPVGSFYISTKNVSPQTFLGGTWESRSGYMLRAATSDVTFDKANDTNDGGADSVEVSSVASHNHSVDAISISSSGAHQHKPYYTTTPKSGGSGAEYPSCTSDRSSSKSSYYINASDGSHTHSVPSHTAKDKGASYTISTLPKYKNVYMWERTA